LYSSSLLDFHSTSTLLFAATFPSPALTVKSAMFFSKLILPFFAILGFVAVASASPVATRELVARTVSSDAVVELQTFDTAVVAALVTLDADIKAKVDLTASITVLADLFVASKNSYNAKGSNIIVSADVGVFASVSVDVVAKVLASIKLISVLDLTAFAQIDVFLSAWLTALAHVSVGVDVTIGKGIPTVDLNAFVSLKLVLTATVLGLVNILGIVGL